MESQAKRGASRSSLACLPCRSRHIKCDGTKPICRRCEEADSGQQCQYKKSRRGGLDRAALAERRRRLAAAEESDGGLDVNTRPPPDTIPVSLDNRRDPGNTTHSSTPSSSSPLNFQSEFQSVESDSLVESYYRNFHKFHPMVVPRNHLAQLYRDPGKQAALKPLIAVLRLIGHIYSNKAWPTQADEIIGTYLSQVPQRHPFLVQCRILYSVALFWYDDKDSSKRQMTAAGELAVELGMNRKEFAEAHGEGDAILAESWRRTWWWTFILEAYYLGTLGTLEFAVIGIEATVDLPCQEDEYESGNIPEPRSQDDYESREFLDDDISFSSFAHLIGAVKCAASAIETVPKILSGEASAQVLQAADSKLDGWLLLLPDGPKHVMSKHGEIDELLYQAFLVVHVAAVGLHRPLSDLKFNLVESVSSCAREPPVEIPTPDLVNIHTIRVLRAVEAQIRLLALPVRPFHHTPFTTCMVSEGTLALLSACNFQFKGKDLQIARDQIRMTIGCLKTLGEVWPRTARNVGEIRTIARHVLELGKKVEKEKEKENDTPGSEAVPSLSSGNEASLCSEGEMPATQGDFLSSLGDLDLCGFDPMGGQMVNIGDLDAGLSWWPSEL